LRAKLQWKERVSPLASRNPLVCSRSGRGSSVKAQFL
jgi:hypothetical protein